MGADEDRRDHLLELATDIAAAYVKGNSIAAEDLPGLIESIYTTLSSLDTAEGVQLQDRTPAVPIEESVTDDYLVCLEDGKKLTMLKRYLRTRYGLSPEAYRAKWGLPADYPMVAPNYAAKRSALAKQIGLGKSKPSPE